MEVRDVQNHRLLWFLWKYVTKCIFRVVKVTYLKYLFIFIYLGNHFNQTSIKSENIYLQIYIANI